jgi:hypothetical protein
MTAARMRLIAIGELPLAVRTAPHGNRGLFHVEIAVACSHGPAGRSPGTPHRGVATS